MQLQWMLFINLYTLARCDLEPILLSKTHSTRLEKYKGYISVAILHFKVPVDTHFASFRFQAEEVALTIFGCRQQNVSVYLKEGSPPVINPDGSKFPENFMLTGRPAIHILEFLSNNKQHYVNITAPALGSYFAAAFISYSDPKNQGITQEGLTPDCITFLNSALYVKQKPPVYVASPNKDLHVLLHRNATRTYKFYTSEVVDSAILTVRYIEFCETCKELSIRIQPHKIPTENDSLYDVLLKREDYSAKSFALNLMTVDNSWNYVSFYFLECSENEDLSYNNGSGQFVFKISYFSYRVNLTYENVTLVSSMEVKMTPVQESDQLDSFRENGNKSMQFKRSIIKSYQNRYLDYSIPFTQFNLVRDSFSQSFMYSFDLLPNSDGFVPLVLNVTDQEVFILKIHLNPGLDIGGTLEFSLAFKPLLKIRGSKTIIESNRTDNQTLVGCVTNKGRAIPTWPDKCLLNNESIAAPIIINNTIYNNTLYIPYPEPGDWYATFKLFCTNCKPCKCSDSCKKQYKSCPKLCESECERVERCDSCIENCENTVRNKRDCLNCDCAGSCEKSNRLCISKVLFSFSSFPCVGGRCGSHGRCMYSLSEGLAYSTCVCSNHYRGWDCTDGSESLSRGMILLELLLLVLSNLMFLPAVYQAYKRGYYIEAMIYFATCFFSTFYHACDAGENIYTFCIVRLPALQFSDFFCGLLSIWVTIIAMAHIPNPGPSICHIAGALLLSFFTAINKTALWVFAIPFLTGMVILIISWYLHYRKTKVRFPSKRYVCIIFPSGLLVVGVGLLLYGLLQTQANYKYLHSMWHMLMALAIIILLPRKASFLPQTIQTIE